MRNLKKILALVLALVMSLSLMATASAADTTAANDAATLYKTAGDVLVGLKVVKGDAENPNDYRFNDPIIRAEAAALIYRVHTGDVADVKADLHDYTPFTDLAPVQTWATGYISYAHNAGIVKGNGNGTFSPLNNITGYEALAMTLRAMGYGKNGEFEGDNWRQTTASWAQRIGLFKGVSAADQTATRLDQPATRGLVFQIMFNAMLLDEVQFSALNPYNYDPLDTTLGQRNFGLEDVAGVVVANQWANLDTDTVLPADTTRMVTTDGKVLTLDTATDLDAVGQTHTAYIANGGENGTKRALTLELGENTVAFNEGKETSVSDLAKTKSLSLSDADYYVNYKENWKDEATSDILLRYVVTEYSIKNGQKSEIAEKWLKYLTESKNVTAETITLTFSDGSKVNTTEYTRTMRPDTVITPTDLAIMQEIFYSANRYWRDPDYTSNNGYVDGEVYVGTTSLEDVSDKISWTKFEDEYLDYGRVSVYDDAEYGESLRIIDNNGDGKAEYVFKIEYTQDKVIATYKDELVLNSLKMADYTGNNRYDPDEVKVGDIVNYNVIDGKLSIWPAEIVTGKVTTKNFRDNTVTVDSDATYNQSGITNATTLDDLIMQMEDKVDYNMYLDEFGNIRTYELANGPEYALLTEMYPTTTQNWNYVNTNTVWAELTIKDADAKEYVASSSNLFNSSYVWTQRLVGTNTNLPQSGNYNYLQPAIAHLGYQTRNGRTYEGWTSTVNAANRAWNRNVYHMNAYDNTIPNYPVENPALPAINNFFGVFAYRPVNNGTPEKPNWSADFSFTNVARHVIGEDGESVTLNTASQRYVDRNGDNWFYGQETNGGQWVKRTAQGWLDYYAANTATAITNYPTTASEFTAQIGTNFFYVYATDYVQLNIEAVKAGKNHWAINGNYATNYNTNSNTYVDALDTTEFYIARPGKADYVVGYNNLPTLDAAKIRAVYAVAQNTAADNYAEDYWTADVIVIEVTEVEQSYDSISLMYYNPYETSGSVRYLNSLNNQWRALEAEDADITVVPSSGTVANYSWGNHSWTSNDYGFYALYHADKEGLNADGELPVSMARQLPNSINGNYNANGIYAGIVTRMNRVSTSHYIDVNKVGINTADSFRIAKADGTDDVPFYKLVVGARGAVSAVPMFLSDNPNASDVQVGDYIIWVYAKGSTSEVAYVVDLGNLAGIPTPHSTKSVVDVTKNPSWLVSEWSAISTEQLGSTVTDLQKALLAAESAIAANDLAAMRAALATLNSFNAADFNGTEWGQITAAKAELDVAIVNQPVEEAKNEARAKLEELKSQILAEYSSNPNLQAALDAVDDELADLETALDAIAVDPATGKYSDPTANAANAVSEGETALTAAIAAANTALTSEPVVPTVVAPTGITVTDNEDNTYDLDIPGTTPVSNGYSFDIQVEATKEITAIDDTGLPTGWTATYAEKPSQTASQGTVAEYDTWTITLHKALGADDWADGTIVITLSDVEEPASPNDLPVIVSGEGLSVSPTKVTRGQSVGTLTITAGTDLLVPDTLTSVTMVGTAAEDLAEDVEWTYTPAADKKTAELVFEAYVLATGRITITGSAVAEFPETSGTDVTEPVTPPDFSDPATAPAVPENIPAAVTENPQIVGAKKVTVQTNDVVDNTIKFSQSYPEGQYPVVEMDESYESVTIEQAAAEPQALTAEITWNITIVLKETPQTSVDVIVTVITALNVTSTGVGNKTLMDAYGVTVTVDNEAKEITYRLDVATFNTYVEGHQDALTNTSVLHGTALYCPIVFKVPGETKGVACKTVLDGASDTNTWFGPADFTAGTAGGEGTMTEWFRFANVSNGTATPRAAMRETYTIELYNKPVTYNAGTGAAEVPQDATKLGTSEWTVIFEVTPASTPSDPA